MSDEDAVPSGVDVPRSLKNAEAAAAAATALWRSIEAPDSGRFFGALLPELAAAVGGEWIAVAAACQGRWVVVAQHGAGGPMPTELVAEVADRGRPAAQEGWAAVPLRCRVAEAQVLVVRCRNSVAGQQSLGRLAELAPVLAAAMDEVAEKTRRAARAERLEAILNIVSQWNRTQEVEPLLVQMAEAATRLLGADRASIFLWDKRTRTLIGRPALGVPGGQLRIPDDRGVVGQVIRSGQPLRVDAATEPDRIDRQVDIRLGYTTRTVLCVPLRGRSGELFGAFEVINKHDGPFTEEDEAGLVELAAHAAIALENARDREKLLSTSRQITEEAAQQVQLIGQSRPIQALRAIIERVADTDLAVLILGENGTGKEVVARMIHYLSSRRHKPFVAVNCAAIPDTLAESELFGHEKGAFTDAHQARPGKFELAADGTLFLDEIGDLSLSGQAKLLRVLEEKILVRVGGSTPIHTDARVLAATNQNLAEMVRQKRFREDLYFRLNVVTLELPPLRDRREDIMPLAEHFLVDFCRRARRQVPTFSPAARKRLEEHPWPGNVRELRNLMERLAYLTTEDRIEAEDLAFILSPRGTLETAVPPDKTLSEATLQFQKEYIRRAIQRSGGNLSQAAKCLGLHRSNLYRKMRQLNMTLPEKGEPL